MTLTQDERDSWQRMIEERETSLKTRKEQYETWYDGITRRRMFAFARTRKLHESLRKRAGFYSDLSVYVSSLQAKAKKNGGRVRFATVDNASDNEESPQLQEANGQQTPLQQQLEQGQQQQQQQQQQQRSSNNSSSNGSSSSSSSSSSKRRTNKTKLTTKRQ